MSKPCSKCKGEMTTKIHDPFSGEEGGLSLTVNGMPAMVCEQGHKRFIHVEFAAQLMDLMVNPETYSSILGATKKGLFKKHYHCPNCAMELSELPTGHKRMEVVAEIKKADPFKVVVDVPVTRCNGCDKESIRSAEETGKLAFRALDHAYRSIDIHPT